MCKLINIFIFIVSCICLFCGAITSAQEPTSSLFKPFKTNSAAPVVKSEPAVIWTRMRNGFTLPTAKEHPRINFYVNKYSSNHRYVNEMVNNAYPYLHFIVEEIEKRGLPLELALLPMVESTFDPHAKSRSGAVGLWQIMPSTGKYFGLEQHDHFEGCRDIVSSTHAALTHLEYLYKRFKNDWLLALAAYNSGEGKVMRAIQKNRQAHKPTDFWSLNLPKETTDYVPKLLALVKVIKYPSKYNVKVPNIPNKPYFATVENSKALSLDELAKQLNISKQELYRLNAAHVTKNVYPNTAKTLLVPIHCQKDIKKNIQAVNEFVPHQPALYTVKKGDTLESIAKKYHISIKMIQEHNKIKGQLIRVGTKLEIPKPNQSKPAGKTIHVVKPGDSLWRLSKQYRVPIQNLASNNNLSTQTALKPGQKLIIEV